MYYENFEMLCNLKGVRPGTVSKATGISTATLTSWKQSKYTPKQDKLQLIADYFGVTVDYLMTGTEPKEKPVAELTKRDHRDIKKSVDEIMTSLDKNNGETLYYDGVEVHLSDETKALLRNALTLTMQAVKLENKEKYNPHKNGK